MCNAILRLLFSILSHLCVVTRQENFSFEISDIWSYSITTKWSQIDLWTDQKIKILRFPARPGAHRRVSHGPWHFFYRVVQRKCCNVAKTIRTLAKAGTGTFANTFLQPGTHFYSALQRGESAGEFHDRGTWNSVRMIGKVGAAYYVRARAWFTKEFISRLFHRPLILLFCARLSVRRLSDLVRCLCEKIWAKCCVSDLHQVRLVFCLDC